MNITTLLWTLPRSHEHYYNVVMNITSLSWILQRSHGHYISMLNFVLLVLGVVGDWKNFFTVAQNEQFDAIYRREMSGLDADFIFDI